MILHVTLQIANEIRGAVSKHHKLVPTVVEVPSKDKPYSKHTHSHQ